MEKTLSDETKEEYLFIYERSRFRSAVVGVIVTSVLIAALGMFMWPILRDMNGNWGEMFQSAALILGAIMLVTIIVGMYFFARMAVSFSRYGKGLKKRNHSLVPTLVAFAVAVLFVAAVPVVIFALNLID